jgi:ABC-type nickel/cobalt efflux system permease component RcnA
MPHRIAEKITAIGSLLSMSFITFFQGAYNLLVADETRSVLSVVSLLVGICLGIATIWATVRRDRREERNSKKK